MVTSAVPVLFIADSLLELAGSERNLFEIVTRLDRTKYAPSVMCMRGGAMKGLLRARGVEVIDLGLSKIYGLAALSRARKVYRFIKERQVKIVVTYHESSDYFGGVVAALADVPVRISSRRDMGYMLKPRHHRMYRLVYPLFHRIVTVSEAVKGVIAEREKQPWHKLLTIYNGTSLERFGEKKDPRAARAALGIPDGVPVVGMLAVFRRVKGHRTFFEAAVRILERHPRTRFVAAGWTPDPWYYDEIRTLTWRLGIEDKVIFTGGRTDVPELLAAMDVSVFASDNEGFSNAVVESMAAGKAVVATDGGGTAEAVVDGSTGILVPPGNPGALATAIIKLIENPALAREMGDRARNRAQALFGVEKMMCRVEELFDTLLEERHGRTPGRGSIRRATAQALKLVAGNVPPRSRRTGTPGRNRGLMILAYHRVGNHDCFIPGMSIRVPNFEKQIAFIAKRFRPLALEEAVSLLAGKGRVPEDAIVITFDDGYRDNYTNAFPILKRYGVPATIFLSVGAIERGETLWFDLVAEGFRLSAEREIDLRGLGLGRYSLDGKQRRVDVANEAIEHAKLLAPHRRSGYIAALFSALKVSPGSMGGRRLMMGWDEVREMVSGGITFGSHGMSHEILSRLSRSELEYEIGESKRMLGERAGIDAKLFAYPNGGAGDFTPEAERVLEKYGYQVACTLVKGTNGKGAGMLSLKRICVTEGMESNPFGRFSKSIFAKALRNYAIR